MLIVTVFEFYNAKIYELDERVYHRIKAKFAAVIGWEKADKFLEKHARTTLATISANSFVNIMDCFQVI